MTSKVSIAIQLQVGLFNRPPFQMLAPTTKCCAKENSWIPIELCLFQEENRHFGNEKPSVYNLGYHSNFIVKPIYILGEIKILSPTCISHLWMNFVYQMQNFLTLNSIWCWIESGHVYQVKIYRKIGWGRFLLMLFPYIIKILICIDVK